MLRRWLYKHARVESGQKRVSHLSLAGGTFFVRDEMHDTFMLKYASFSEPKCLVEVGNRVFPFFIDLDVLDTEAHDDEEVLRWCRAATRSVSEMNIDAATASSDDEDASCDEDLDRVKRYIAAMDPQSAAICRAPSREVVKGGVTHVKTGVHVIWPALLVTRETALRLRTIAILGLHRHCPGKPWDDIVDASVYRKKVSLRMLHSLKTSHCDDPTCIQQAEYRRVLQPVIPVLSNEFGIYGPREDVEKHLARMKLDTVRGDAMREKVRKVHLVMQWRAAHKKVYEACRCSGYGKFPDPALGAYEPLAVLDEEGAVSLSKRAMDADPLLALYLFSIRRPDGVGMTEIEFPRTAPMAAPVVVIRRKRTAEDGDPEENDTDSSVDEITDRTFMSDRALTRTYTGNIDRVALDDDAARQAVEAEIRAGTFGDAYKQIMIEKVYRLEMGSQRKVKFLDGAPHHVIIATPRSSYGCNFCPAARRCHSTNTVYFEFRGDQTGVVRCFSTKSEACKKLGSAGGAPLGWRTQTTLFPFAERTVNCEVTGELSSLKTHKDRVAFHARTGVFPPADPKDPRLLMALTKKRKQMASEAQRERSTKGAGVNHPELLEFAPI